MNGNKLFILLSNFSVSEDVAHGEPDVLDLRGVVQELLPLALLAVSPVAGQAIVHPGPLHIH